MRAAEAGYNPPAKVEETLFNWSGPVKHPFQAMIIMITACLGYTDTICTAAAVEKLEYIILEHSYQHPATPK